MLADFHARLNKRLTCNAGEQLTCKILYLRAWKRYKSISFQEVEHALPEQVRDNADVVAEIERVPQVYTLVSIVLIV